MTNPPDQQNKDNRDSININNSGNFTADISININSQNTSPDPTIQPRQPDESLILIARFHRRATQPDASNVHYRLYDELLTHINRLNLTHTRVELLPDTLRAAQRKDAESIGHQYDATLIIWGEDTEFSLQTNLLDLTDSHNWSRLGYVQLSADPTTQTYLAAPSQYVHFVTTDLTPNATFLALFTLGRTAYAAQNYTQTIPLVKQALTTLPPSPQTAIQSNLPNVYFLLATAYYFTNQFHAALPHFTRILDLLGTRPEDAPDTAANYFARGTIYDELNQYDKALNDYNRAIVLFDEIPASTPRDRMVAIAYFARGTIYAKLNSHDKALADFTRAIELDPTYAKAYSNRGNIYVRLTPPEWDKALADHTHAISLLDELNLTDATAIYNKACFYVLTNQPEFAFTHLAQALQEGQDPNWVGQDPDWDNYRTHPRYIELVGSVLQKNR